MARPATSRPSPTRTSMLRRPTAFSLIEVLVASVILMVMLLIVTGLVNNTSELTALSNRRISADAEGRQVLDRISSDLRSAIIRNDLPLRLDKAAGNDSLTFYAQRDGYEGDRGVSQVSYGIKDDHFLRGAAGTFWEDGSEQEQVGFQTTDLRTLDEMDSETMSADIFRLEVAFLMKDGTRKASLPDGTTVADDVSAIIISLAALDSTSRQTADMAAVASLLPDARDGEDIAGLWNDALTSAATDTVPPPVRAGVRIYQRYCYLNR